MNPIELIDLSTWKKQKEILYEFKEYGINLTPRTWRKAVETWNERFVCGEENIYITHSNSLGYKATNDYEEAKIAINDYKKRALNMLMKARKSDMAFKQKGNYQFDFEKGEII